MPPATLKGNVTMKATQSATALKAAGTATLKGGDSTLFSGLQQDAITMKLPLGGGYLSDATMLRKKIETVWDEEPINAGTEQKKKLKSLAGKVEKMAGVFESETQARAQQRQLMDELHNDQMTRLDEISAELEASMQELAEYIETWKQKFRDKLTDTFDDLHSDLQKNVEKLLPRLDALEARGRVLRASIDEETETRIQHNKEILIPVKAQLAKLEAGLVQEKGVRESRAAEIQQRMVEAVEALESGVDAEIAAREDRQVASSEEWKQEQVRLKGRYSSVQRSCDEVIAVMNQEADHENDSRIGGQDPVVEALTRFMQDFHSDIKEKAEMG